MIAFERRHVVEPVNATHQLQPYSSYHEEIELPYSAEQLFDLVADIERYPDFLPGWRSVNVKGRDKNRLYVEQEVGFPLFSFKLNSIAELERPHHLFIVVEGNPFRRLEIDWYFHSMSASITRISLFIKMDAYPGPQQLLLQQYVNHSTVSLLGYFAQRAKSICTINNTPVSSRG